MKHIITTLFVSLVAFGFAQVDLGSTMFWNNYSVFNPAATGLYYKRQGAVSYRDEFAMTSWSRKSLSANYTEKVKFLHGGLGLNYTLDDQAGTRQNKVNLNYSYHLPISRKLTIAAGVSAGVVNVDVRQAYGFLGNSDPVTIIANQTAFVLNAGLVFQMRKLDIGISSTQLNNPGFDKLNYHPVRNFHLNASYKLNLAENFYLKPQVLFTTDADFSRLDINVLAYYKRQFWAGATYRTQRSACFMAGWDIQERFRVGYSFDINPSILSNRTTSHEVVLGFMVKHRPVHFINPSF